MKQDESNGDSKFIVTIGLRGKSTSYWKTKIKQSWKWKGICKASKNPILESNVGQMSFENKLQTCRAHVIFTTRGGMAWNMD